MNWKSPTLRSLIKLALDEDAARQDVTTWFLIPKTLKIEAQIRSKQRGVACGLPMAKVCFQILVPRVYLRFHVREGQRVQAGQLMATIKGQARGILSAERTALNALQHLSGIATYTRQQLKQIPSGRTKIYDTRKTLPGWRELEKYAVRCGGGKNHRMSLADGMLIKDNHLMLLRQIKSDWVPLVQRFRRRFPSLPVELEVQNARDLQDAFRLRPDQVLLDNMRPAKLKGLVKTIRSRMPRAKIEVSGGVRSDQLKRLGRLGVERVSMGRLTHSAPAFDCALEISRVFNPR